MRFESHFLLHIVGFFCLGLLFEVLHILVSLFAIGSFVRHVGRGCVFIREYDALLAHGLAVGSAVVLGFGALAIFDALATLGELRLALHLDSILFFQFKDALRVYHGQQHIGEVVASELKPIREKYEDLRKNKDYLETVYKTGAERAYRISNKTLSKVKRKVGFVDRPF